MYSHEIGLTLDSDHRGALLAVAAASIEHGLDFGRSLEPVLVDYSNVLHEICATFVTLRIDSNLRGCMGALRATDALVVDVARNAFSAAFCDPRFEKLTRAESQRLDISISILSPSHPIEARSQDDLLANIRPGIDGLIVYEGQRRGTLLPAVWESIADPLEFLVHLKRKAGLPDDYWSDTIRFERYTASSIKR